LLFLCLPAILCAGEYWGSLSIRSPYIEPAPFDYEIKVGGSNFNSSFMYGVERENGIIYKMSDMQYHYTNFRFKWERKEARQIDFTEALWSTQFEKAPGFSYGGSLRNDMIINETKYLAYAKYNRGNITAEAYHNGMDYYAYSAKYQGRIYRRLRPLIIYKNVNGQTYYQAKVVYRFYVKKENG